MVDGSKPTFAPTQPTNHICFCFILYSSINGNCIDLQATLLVCAYMFYQLDGCDCVFVFLEPRTMVQISYAYNFSLFLPFKHCRERHMNEETPACICLKFLQFKQLFYKYHDIFGLKNYSLEQCFWLARSYTLLLSYTITGILCFQIGVGLD